MTPHTTNGARRGMERRHGPGFTLIELMVTIAVLAIMIGLATPSFLEMSLSSRLTSIANSLSSSVQLARSEAIKRNQPVTLCASTDGETCDEDTDWSVGWVALAGTTVLQREQAVPSGYVVASTEDSLVFQPTGAGATLNSFTICRQSPSAGAQERVVSVSATARTKVSKTTTGSCP